MDRLVAIDGPAGSGKSTLARLLARALSLPYINTGLMYRALTRLALDVSASSDDGPALAALIDRLSFGLSHGDDPELEVEGYDLVALESFEVDSNVSAVSRHPEVRERLRALQRAFGEQGWAVMEGRDIGSVVFPDARVKIYLVADPEIRARRRSTERQTSVGGIEEALHRRDEHDARTNPFGPAEGAVVIDTASADAGDVLDRALEVVADIAPELIPETH